MLKVKKRIWLSATFVTWPNCVLVGFRFGPCHCWRLNTFCASMRSCHVRPPPAPKLRWIDRFVNVNGMPRTPSMRNGKARFWNAAGILAGSRSNPASMLNHSLARRVVERDVVEVPVEEDVLAPQSSSAPGWYSHVPLTCQLPAIAASTPPSSRNRRPRPNGSS